MKFLQIRKRKIKFPSGTGIRGQPAAVATHADARPRRTARTLGLGAGGTRPAQAGHRTGHGRGGAGRAAQQAGPRGVA